MLVQGLIILKGQMVFATWNLGFSTLGSPGLIALSLPLYLPSMRHLLLFFPPAYLTDLSHLYKYHPLSPLIIQDTLKFSCLCLQLPVVPVG